MEFDNLVDTLNMIGELARDQYKAKIRKGAYATGKLFNSIEYKLTVTENGVKLYLTMLDYYIYVEEGRKVGSMPPVSAIKKWMLTKGLPNNNALAWKISHSIAKNGIKAKPYIREIKATLPSFTDDIQKAFEKDVEIELEKIIKKK